jgi:hypothetical protein
VLTILRPGELFFMGEHQSWIRDSRLGAMEGKIASIRLSQDASYSIHLLSVTPILAIHRNDDCTVRMVPAAFSATRGLQSALMPARFECVVSVMHKHRQDLPFVLTPLGTSAIDKTCCRFHDIK